MLIISESGELGNIDYQPASINYKPLSHSTYEISMLTDDYIEDTISNRSSILNRQDIREYPELIKMIRALINLKRLLKDNNYEKR